MLQRLAIALMIVSVVVIFASVPLAYWLSTHYEALALPTVVGATGVTMLWTCV